MDRLPAQLRDNTVGVGRAITIAVAAWSVLVAVVIGLYRMYRFGLAPWFPAFVDWLQWAPVLLALGLLGFLIRLLVVSRRTTTLNSQGLALLLQGDRAGALRIFEQVLAGGRGVWTTRVVALWNIGMANLLDGRYAEALAAYERLEGVRFRKGLREVYEGVPSMVALCHALTGDIEDARGALEEQRRRRTQLHARTWMLPEAIVLARSGVSGEALELLDREFPALEAGAGGHFLRPARLVRAFVAESAGAGRPQLVAALEPVADLAWARGWPELTAWARAKGLVA